LTNNPQPCYNNINKRKRGIEMGDKILVGIMIIGTISLFYLVASGILF
jgi:hypothetical protein